MSPSGKRVYSAGSKAPGSEFICSRDSGRILWARLSPGSPSYIWKSPFDHHSTHLWTPVSRALVQSVSSPLSPFVWLCKKSLIKFSRIIAFVTRASHLPSTQEFKSGKLYCMFYLRNSARFTIYQNIHLKGRTSGKHVPVLLKHSLCKAIQFNNEPSGKKSK